MFRDEALLAMQLEHPHVVQVVDVGEEGTLPFLVMEFLNGLSLRTFMRRYERSRMPIGQKLAARIIRDVLDGLQYVHDAGLSIVHRDLKPENVFLTYNGDVKILDFGLARSSLRTVETAQGSIRGTLAYMAPEQVVRGPLDRRTDVFASGVILWELVTGKKFVSGPSVMKAMMRILYDPILTAREVDPTIDPGLSEVIARAMARDPAGRFATAGEMRDALDAILHTSIGDVTREEIGAAVSIRPTPVETRASRSLLRVSGASSEPTESQTTLKTEADNDHSMSLVNGADEPTLELPTAARASVRLLRAADPPANAPAPNGWRRLAGMFLGAMLFGIGAIHGARALGFGAESRADDALVAAPAPAPAEDMAIHGPPRSPRNHGPHARTVQMPNGAPGVQLPRAPKRPR
jgi:serine/threonine-protein kinase